MSKTIDGIEETEDLLDVLKPKKESSEEYKIIMDTLASTDENKLKLFSDLTRGQVYWMGMAGLYVNIVKKLFKHDIAHPLRILITDIEARSVSVNRGGRKEIIEALKPKAVAETEEKSETLKKLEGLVK